MALYKITRTKVHKAYHIFTYFSYTFKENVSGYKCHRKCSETFNSEKKQMTVALLLKKKVKIKTSVQVHYLTKMCFKSQANSAQKL